LKWFYVFPTGSFGDVVYRFSDEEKINIRLWSRECWKVGLCGASKAKVKLEMVCA
jgi:hypothetical protein